MSPEQSKVARITLGNALESGNVDYSALSQLADKVQSELALQPPAEKAPDNPDAFPLTEEMRAGHAWAVKGGRAPSQFPAALRDKADEIIRLRNQSRGASNYSTLIRNGLAHILGLGEFPSSAKGDEDSVEAARAFFYKHGFKAENDFLNDFLVARSIDREKQNGGGVDKFDEMIQQAEAKQKQEDEEWAKLPEELKPKVKSVKKISYSMLPGRSPQFQVTLDGGAVVPVGTYGVNTEAEAAEIARRKHYFSGMVPRLDDEKTGEMPRIGRGLTDKELKALEADLKALKFPAKLSANKQKYAYGTVNIQAPRMDNRPQMRQWTPEQYRQVVDVLKKHGLDSSLSPVKHESYDHHGRGLNYLYKFI